MKTDLDADDITLQATSKLDVARPDFSVVSVKFPHTQGVAVILYTLISASKIDGMIMINL